MENTKDFFQNKEQEKKIKL